MIHSCSKIVLAPKTVSPNSADFAVKNAKAKIKRTVRIKMSKFIMKKVFIAFILIISANKIEILENVFNLKYRIIANPKPKY